MRRAIHRTIDRATNEDSPLPTLSEDVTSMSVVYWPPEYDPGSEGDVRLRKRYGYARYKRLR